MKILILFQDNEGGTKNATKQIIKSLKALYPKDSFTSYAQPLPSYKGYFTYTRKLLWSIWDYRCKINTSKNIDCIYAPEFSGVIAHRLSNKKSIPIFFHYHGKQEFIKSSFLKHSLPRSLYSRGLGQLVEYLQKKALEQSDAICFASDELKEILIKRHKLRSILHKSITVENGVSRRQFHPVSSKIKKMIRKTMGIPEDSKAVLYVGRIDVTKGLHNLIRALNYTNIPNISLFIVYPAVVDSINLPYLTYLKKEAERVSSNKKIAINFIENPKHVPHWYQTADCVVLPSERDNFPLVMLEAFACKTPFIGTQVGSIGFVIKDIEKNLLLDNNDELSIAKRLDWFFSLSSKDISRIKKRGLQKAGQFTWEKTAEKIHGELKRLSRYQ